ncbi:MAG: hypothetical protein IPP86_17510 [Bacteroidetes bacterium]|nr:hypothetical protein [Bacteroidota bacterium]
MQKIIRFLVAFILLGFCLHNNQVFAQLPSAPIIDTPLTTSKTYFYNGEIIVPYSSGHVSVTNNSSVNILSTTEVNLLPGFTASTDSGCTQFVAGIQECPTIVYSKKISNISCFGAADGSISIESNIDLTNYKFVWSIPGDNKPLRNNLNKGTYLFTMVDPSGCINYDSCAVIEPDSIFANFSSISTSCGDSNGVATIHLQGGEPPYFYNWFPYGGNDSVATELTSGIYEILVKDSNHCVQKYFLTLPDSSGPEINVDSIKYLMCTNTNTGAIFTHVISGNGPFQYEWINSIDTTPSLINIPSGMYTIMVKDSNQCKMFKSITIPEPSQMSSTMISNNTTCGQTTGNAICVVSGGVPPYHFEWSSGSIDSFIVQLNSGKYSVIISDANGCMIKDSVEILENGGPAIEVFNLANLTCFEGNDGKAKVEVTSGNGPYQYLWLLDSTNTDTISNLIAGIHKVRVTDNNGCSTMGQVNIYDPPRIYITLLYDPPTTDSSTDGNVYSQVEGGTPEYTYQWSNSNTQGPDLYNVPIGTYTLTVTDANGCQTSQGLRIASYFNGCYHANPSVVCQTQSPSPCGTGYCYKDIYLDFGADPTGNYNSTCAFSAAVDFFNARNGHGILNIPPGTYIVGEQSRGGGFYLTGQDIMCFNNCEDLVIQGKVVGTPPKIKFENCMRFGMFDPSTGDRYIFNTGNCCDLSQCGAFQYPYCAFTGSFLVLRNCKKCYS